MDITKIEPTGDRYLIEIYQSASESASGLAIENNNNVSAAPVLGTILKVSNKAKEDFKVGDQIFFRRYSIDELKVITPDGEQTIYMVEGSEIVAVVRSNITN
jgi:co-chaperonin GroES (HSP10)